MALDFTHAILEWAKRKPADERYDFCDPSRCAVAQFGREVGRQEFVGLWSDKLRATTSPAVFHAVLGDGFSSSWTYGALAARLEAALPKTIALSDWTRLDAYMADIEQVSA